MAHKRYIVLIKRSIRQKDIAILNVSAPNNRIQEASEYKKQKPLELKVEIHKSTVTAGIFNKSSLNN